MVKSINEKVVVSVWDLINYSSCTLQEFLDNINRTTGEFPLESNVDFNDNNLLISYRRPETLIEKLARQKLAAKRKKAKIKADMEHEERVMKIYRKLQKKYEHLDMDPGE